ncbi:hypothetical protein [Pedobacter alpinus]
MKTKIIKGGVSFLKADYDKLVNFKGSTDDFFYKYIIQSSGVNKQIAQLLANLNRSDGGGPIVNLVDLDSNLNPDFVKGKIDISYQLKLEWGCEAIKKDILKSEKFDVEFDFKENVFYLYLFLV